MGADRTTPDWTDDYQRAFEADLARDERFRFLWLAGVGSFLNPGFAVLDWIVYPQYWRHFLMTRLLTTVPLMAAWVITYFAKSYWSVVWCEAVSFICVGLNVAYMGHVAGQGSYYFAGILVVQAFVGVLSTMPPWMMGVVNAAVIAGYLVPLARYPTLDVPNLANNLFIVGSGAMASILGSTIRGRLAKQEYLHRREISRSNAELKSLHEAKDHMFQNVSHEFRTPLTLILAPIERWLAAPAQMKDEAAAGLASIQRNALRLLNLINDLLELARLGSDAATDEALPSAPEDVRGLLARIAEDAGPLSQQKGIEFEARIPADPLIYVVPARSLEKIVLNLLSNALKFTPKGGQVTLSAAVDAGGGLTLAVADTGIGIPPEAHAKIFERFRQVDGSTTRKYGGTGIGLALVAELSRRMGAELKLDSARGKGSTFSLRLPATLRATDARKGAAEPVEHSLDVARRAAVAALGRDAGHEDVRTAGDHGPRVLLAEDNPELNAEIVRMLSPLYRVRSVADGELAAREALREPPDVLLSDVMMPGMDGVTLAHTLRQQPALRDTAIVLLSARASLEDRVRGREVGVDTYLTKPFNPRELFATLEGLLRSRMRVVGRYLLGARLGEGAQCEVFRAEHLETRQQVALKMISSRQVGDGSNESWLAREREALSRLSHPNIVKILEQGEQEGRFFMVMEHLEGATLAELGTRGARFGAAGTAAIGQALSEALAAVHGVGLVHRDVKRENVMVLNVGKTLQERVRLIDFGVVLDTSRDTNIDNAGTLSYMAPELLLGEPSTSASDQYAVGVCLYQLLSGQHPFRQDTADRTRAVILAAQRQPLASLVPNAPLELREIIERAIRPQAAERWPNMGAMAHELARLARDADAAAGVAAEETAAGTLA